MGCCGKETKKSNDKHEKIQRNKVEKKKHSLIHVCNEDMRFESMIELFRKRKTRRRKRSIHLFHKKFLFNNNQRQLLHRLYHYLITIN